ncbi:type IV pilus secretin family protein [Mariprofundus ferrooxydans]|uniref:type IV pilus secretin family protein n=1 Tax=Mariprofundus ferrooxydans TaxID=314344 RepID=UPI001E41D607|nr:type IV pilus secretin family protein [Mariprofundus ferrooxydans]
MITMFVWLMAPAVQAATIEGINMLADGPRQSLRISMDAPIAYQVFNLEGPARVVLQFPHTTLAKGVVPLKGAGGVEQVVPSQDSDGVRVEIGMAGGTTYNIAEKGNDLLLSFTAKTAQQSSASGAVVQDIEVRDQGKSTEVILRGQHMDANHNALLTNEGETMVLDFWGGSSKLPKEYYTYTSPRLNDVTVGSADGRLRLVMSLRAGAGAKHQIEADNNQMVIRFGDVAAKPKAGVVVEAVDFQPDDRISHLVVRTDSTDPVINLQEEGDKVILDLKQAHLAPGQERTQDVRAFPGPVEQIDAYSVNKDVRIVTRLRQKSVVSSYQSGNVLTVTIKPKDMVASAQADDEAVKSEKVYTGQKVTFNYKDIDIRNALKLIAEMSDFNIIMSDDVKGVLTMRLIDVPWDQALDLILSARGLGKEQNGNVVRIAPLAVLKADANARKEAKQSVEDVAPLETEFITLGYASVNDVKTILEGGSVKTAVTSTGGAAGGTAGAAGTGQTVTSSSELKLLSQRGVIMLDERSNTMIITDTRERLNNIKRLIAVIDKPMQQVMVEARIVEASDTFSRDLGVKWGGTLNSNGGGYTHTVTGKSVGTNVVDLGAAVGAGAGGAIGYTLGTLNNALNLNLELSAAEAEGQIKVVSSPRVFTSNLQEALIEQDTQIPFPVTTASTPPVVSYQLKSSKLTLKVTPQITADKRIIMQLVVNKDTPVQGAANAPPTIDKKQVLTKLLVKNGETVVLGGIYTQTTSDQVNGVPGLQDIPFIGHLFKRKQKTHNRTELLIFITPTIIADDALKN